jgi:hypothetical protein
MRFAFAVLILLFNNVIIVWAQQAQISFIPKWQNRVLELGKYYPIANIDSIKFDAVKFYITDISLWNQGKQVYVDPTKYHLIDLELNNKVSLNLPSKLPYDTIQFLIGTDSAANSSGAMAGDLDAMYGMYWAWQSGYINVKIEGSSSVCKTRKNAFQYHLGGFLSPNQTIQQLAFATTSNSINVAILIDSMLQPQSLMINPEVMSPSAQAVKQMQQFKQSFQLVR